MRILIVNGYNQNKSGLKKFADFHYLIMKMMTEQKELVDTETEFFIRDKNNLDDYLYEIESSYLKKEAANNFDQLDMVFIIGDANVRPWSPSMKKVLTLVRMCLRVKKYFFASAWAMQALIFLCASNLEKNINIINGQGDGGKLSDIQNASNSITSIKPNDYFLDNTTGDMYGFNYETSEWIPKGNCGLHSRRSAQEFQSLGKYIVKAPIYKANTDHKSKYKLFKSREYEETCRIKKTHMHHWLVVGLDDEFIIPLKNQWDIHTFSFINFEKHFNCLADSERGPIMIEMENIIGVLFSTNTQYPDTIQPLRNFIWSTLKKIKSTQGVQSPSISSYQFAQKESTIEETLRRQKEKSKRQALVLLNKRAQQSGFHQVDAADSNSSPQYTKSDVFLHVGYSAKKSHVPQYVYHNMVNDKNLKIKEGRLKLLNNDQFTRNTPIIGNSMIQNQMLDQDELLEMCNQSSILKHRDSVTAKPGSSPHFEAASAFRIKRISSSNRLPLRQDALGQYQTGNIQIMNSGAIRKTLHPTLPQDLFDQKQLWVPGNLSNPDNTLKRGVSVNPSNGGSFLASTQGSRVQTSQRHQRNHTQDLSTTLVKSKTQRGKDFGDFKSLFGQSPYITLEDMYKKDMKERQSKIIGERDFRVGAAPGDFSTIQKNNQGDSNIGQTVNSGDNQKSQKHHEFRVQRKEKWISQENFKLV